MIIETCLLGFVLYQIITYLYAKSLRRQYSSYKDVPTVRNMYPIVGHGITFSKDIIGFVRKAYKDYGGIYKIKVFNRTYAVVSDRSMLKEYFKTPEEEQSLYKVLDNLFFGMAFSDDKTSLLLNIKMIKQTVAIKFDAFAPKIHEESLKMIERLKSKVGQKIDITDEMIRFVSSTSAKCFLGVTFDENVFSTFIKFTKLLNKIIVLTYFFPKWLINMTIGRTLRKYRLEIIEFMKPEIRSYREDPSKNESLLIRYSVDYFDLNTKKRLTDDEIGGFITCLLYVSSENTALGLVATATNIGMNPYWWHRIRDETKEILKNDDSTSLLRELFAVCTLDDVFMESSRMNTHVFPLNRAPTKKKTLSGYYVGDVDSIVLCEPEILMFKEAEKIFKHPQEYIPSRYRNEPKDSQSHTVFGSGNHLCPGKSFAIYEIKAAISLIVNTFDIDMPKVLPELSLFSPSAFGERSFEVVLRLKTDKKTNPDAQFVPEFPTQKIIERYDCGEHAGWLIREFLEIDQQKELYNYTTNQIEVNAKPTNCSQLVKWKEIANSVIELLKSRSDIHFKDFPDNYVFNSTSVQLFDSDSKHEIEINNDQNDSWCVKVSIGATAEYKFGDKTIFLNGGDVFLTPKALHSVQCIYNNVPQWYNDSNIKTYGYTRAEVQIENSTSFEETK